MNIMKLFTKMTHDISERKILLKENNASGHLKVSVWDLLKCKVGWGKDGERARRGKCCFKTSSFHSSIQGGQLWVSGN